MQFTDDAEYSIPVTGGKVEDEKSGDNGSDKQFKVGDSCSASWLDGKDYRGKVVYENGMLKSKILEMDSLVFTDLSFN